MDITLAAKGFMRWLLPTEALANSGEDIPVFSPDDIYCLENEGWLKRNEILTIYAYCRAAAFLNSSLLPKVQTFNQRVGIPEKFDQICSSLLPMALREANSSLTIRDLLLKPPVPVAKAISSVLTAYRAGLNSVQRVRISSIRPIVFEHASDRKALSTLKAIPGLKSVTNKVVDLFKKSDEMALLGSAMLATHQSMPEIYAVLVEACEILGVSPIPPLYLKFGSLESYTLGGNVPHIVLGSIAISLFSREELLFLLGHELGHIKAGHVIYLTLAKSVKDSAKLASPFTLGLAEVAVDMTISPALAIWSRRSEFTADRAGFLVCQDKEIALQALMKLSGYPPQLYSQMHIRSIVAQGHRFRARLADNTTDRFFNISNLWDSSHPNTVERALELLWWVQEAGTDILKMTPLELTNYAKLVDIDPTQAELQQVVIRDIADWAHKNHGVYPSIGRRLVRRMITGFANAKNTELERILQIQYTLRKISADHIEHLIYLLVNEHGKPYRVCIPASWNISWDALPDEMRSGFIRSGQSELSWNLYAVT